MEHDRDVRQLDFHFGEAQARGADTVLVTGAVQSNLVRLAAAGARRLGMEAHVQLEERVEDAGSLYRASGNLLLDRLLGATLHAFPVGEDEAAADAALERRARALADEGRRPYVIHSAPGHPPLGGLGYVLAIVPPFGSGRRSPCAPLATCLVGLDRSDAPVALSRGRSMVRLAAAAMHDRCVCVTAIATRLAVDYHTVDKALRWFWSRWRRVVLSTATRCADRGPGPGCSSLAARSSLEPRPGLAPSAVFRSLVVDACAKASHRFPGSGRG